MNLKKESSLIMNASSRSNTLAIPNYYFFYDSKFISESLSNRLFDSSKFNSDNSSFGEFKRFINFGSLLPDWIFSFLIVEHSIYWKKLKDCLLKINGVYIS